MRWMLVVIAVLLPVATCGRADPSTDRTIAATSPVDPTAPPGTPAPPTGPVADHSVEPASTTTTTTAPERLSFTLAFTGDLLLHDRVNAMAAGHASERTDRTYDYRPLLAPIRPWLEDADWAVCHMEVNLSSDGTRLAPYPRFRAPGQIAFDARDLGYDSCSVASNHSLDHGTAGVAETLDVLDAAGLRSTGTARSALEAAARPHVDVAGVAVAHFSYAYWFNGFEVPAEAPWTANVIDEARIVADATAARVAGARYVVVSLHWGEQYRHEPTETQRSLGARLLASPAIDLVIGHHVHVVQPIDLVDGKWLVYGLGNLLSNSAEASRRDELLVVASVVRGDDGRFATDLEVVPLHQDQATLVVRPTNPSTRSPTGDPGLEAELDASWRRVMDVLETGSGVSALTLG